MIRSMVADDVNHPGGCLLMNTGERVATRPSLGAWVTYGLGTENQNLPGFVAIGPGPLIEGARQYGAGFLPAAYQGTFVSDLKNPIRNLKNDRVSPARQRRELDALRRFNELHRDDRPDDSRLSARIESFELAYRMQIAGPRRLRPGRETEATQRLYGSIGEDDRGLRPPVPAGAPAGGARRAVRAALPHDRRLPAVGPAQRPEGRPRPATPWRPTGPSPACCRTCRRAGCWRRRW